MDFSNLRAQDILCLLDYAPDITEWKSANRSHFIGIQLSGRSVHDFGYQRFTLCENTVFFFNQRDAYTVKVLEKGVSSAIHFTTLDPIETDSFCVKLTNPAEVTRLMNQIGRGIISDPAGDNMTLSSFYRLCDMLNGYREKEYTQNNPRLQQAKEYLDLHFREENCLEQAAAQSGVTRRRFNDIFKAQYNLTPNRYLTHLKINSAKNYMRLGNASVTQAALLSGFTDICYFSKVFKAQTGINPGEFKKNLL